MTPRQTVDTQDQQLADLERLIEAQGVGRHAMFFHVGEGTYLPDGSEEITGYVLDTEGRAYYFALGWDLRRQTKALVTWEQVPIEPHWANVGEYRRAREVVGLGGDERGNGGIE